LNTAFIQSGIFIWIPKNVKLETPLQVTFIAAAGVRSNASFPPGDGIGQPSTRKRVGKVLGKDDDIGPMTRPDLAGQRFQPVTSTCGEDEVVTVLGQHPGECQPDS
jgi:hypothetical protein